MKITVQHIMQATMCSGGARAWFVAHDLDWTDFVMNGGFAEEVFLAIDDAMAHEVVRKAHEGTQ
jgi:hypothetical protein